MLTVTCQLRLQPFSLWSLQRAWQELPSRNDLLRCLCLLYLWRHPHLSLSLSLSLSLCTSNLTLTTDCSEITAELIVLKIGVDRQFIYPLSCFFLYLSLPLCIHIIRPLSLHRHHRSWSYVHCGRSHSSNHWCQSLSWICDVCVHSLWRHSCVTFRWLSVSSPNDRRPSSQH